jgi:hypothetical protein
MPAGSLSTTGANGGRCLRVGASALSSSARSPRGSDDNPTKRSDTPKSSPIARKIKCGGVFGGK